MEDWQRNNLLSNFYQDPKQYAFALQQRVFDSYDRIYRTASALASINPTIPILIERISRSAFRIFTKLAEESNNLTVSNYIALNEQYVRTFFSFDLNVETIYVRVSPSKAFERMLTRGRPEEVQYLSRDYMGQLYELHEQELLSADSNFKAPLVVLDGHFDASNEAHLTWLETLITQASRWNAVVY